MNATQSVTFRGRHWDRDRFLDPGLGPGLTSENRDPGFFIKFYTGVFIFLDFFFKITFENLIVFPKFF